MKKRSGNYGPRYNEAFRAEVVKHCRGSDKSLDELSGLLGVSRPTLKAWLRQAAIDEGVGGEGALTTDERRELRQLRREVEELQAANTILKKAVAFSEGKKR
jgi:transposase